MDILAAYLMVLMGMVDIILGAGMLEIAPVQNKPYAWIFWISLILIVKGFVLLGVGICFGNKIYYSQKEELRIPSVDGPA